jgi:hypothetical protein
VSGPGELVLYLLQLHPARLKILDIGLCHAPLPPVNTVAVRRSREHGMARNGKRNLPLSPIHFFRNAIVPSSV